MKPAFQKGDALLNEILAARDSDSNLLHAWWLGQSGFLVCYRGETILFDPYLSDSLTTKYANSDKPHVRMTEQVIDPVSLRFVDFVTSSHNHTDHLDPDTLMPLFYDNPPLRIVCPRANREEVLNRSRAHVASLIELNDGEFLRVSDSIAIYGIASAHNELELDQNGDHRFMGYILEWGDYTIYHSGDCLPYPGLEDKLADFEIDLAFLPINGNVPERRVAGNFDGREAVDLAVNTRIKHVIPCHYDMFEFNTVSPDLFVQHANERGLNFTVLQNGEGMILNLY